MNRALVSWPSNRLAGRILAADWPGNNSGQAPIRKAKCNGNKLRRQEAFNWLGAAIYQWPSQLVMQYKGNAGGNRRKIARARNSEQQVAAARYTGRRASSGRH